MLVVLTEKPFMKLNISASQHCIHAEAHGFPVGKYPLLSSHSVTKQLVYYISFNLTKKLFRSRLMFQAKV